MREMARIQRGPIYDNSYISNGKSNTTKLPIVLCAVIGILVGCFAFRADNGKVNSIDNKNQKSSAAQLKTSLGGIKNGKFAQIANSKVFETFSDIVFKLFGMDRYNPITIINKNHPYFKMYYQNQFPEYLSQLEMQEQKEFEKNIEQENQNIEKIENEQTEKDMINGDSPEKPLKEVSSSITFEGDIEDSERNNNPVVTSGEISITNQTRYSIDIKKLLKEPLKLKSIKTGPQILIYHTHTTESFIKSIDQLTMKNIESRTTNNKFNVVRVGDALIDNLKKYNISVLHDTTIHDKDYNTSYVNSLKTLTNYVDKYSSLKMTIDLHRDALGEGKLRVKKKVNGKNVAQIMFVIGTDEKLSNPKWRENLKLAIRIQARLNEICPGLAKPIHLSPKRYNQHLTNGSVIIEIGGDGNLVDECVRSTKYLAQAINEVIYYKK